MFVDVADIKIKAGNGGNGAVSFHRDKFTASGGPDGGNGGKGGDIVFKPDRNLSTLYDFRYKKVYKASNGRDGSSGCCAGKKGEDLIIKVPVGTLIKDVNTGRLIADLSSEEPQIIAKGGRGGLGNMNFATPTRQSPRFSKSGTFGEELEIRLELKLLADVGLIGYPNVGKSTFISVVSEAKPKIANYHFTTLIPVLGVVKHSDSLSFVVADIPGLIEGAWKGTGLGHQFLRHIERCRLLVHMVDVSGSEGRNPEEDFEVINNELKKFNSELSSRPMIVIGNKCDIATDEQIESFKSFVESKGYRFFKLSAVSNDGIKSVLDYIIEELSKLPPISVFEPDEYEHTDDELGSVDDIEINVSNGVYYIDGKWLKLLLNSVNFYDYDSMNYFQKRLVDSGVMQKLRDAGAKEGDTVNMCGTEFDFFD